MRFLFRRRCHSTISCVVILGASLFAGLQAAPIINQGPLPQLAPLASQVSFTCAASGATSYQWTKDGQPITGATSSACTIPKVGLTDSGAYRVLVSDGSTQVVSSPASLLVTQPWANPAVFIYNFNQPPPSDPKQPVPDLANNTVGTLQNSPPPVVVPGPKPLGSGWDFAQTNATISVKSCPALKTLGDVTRTTGFSIAVWLNGKPVGRNLRLMGCGGIVDVNSNGNGFDFGIGDSGKMVPIVLTTPDKMMDGEWHHVVVSLDFTTATDNAAMYVDGKRTSVVSRLIDKSFAPDSDFILAGRSNSSGQPHIKIAQVAVFSKGLVPDEINALFQTGSVGNYSPMVVARPNSDRVILPNHQLALLGAVTDQGVPSPATAVWSKVSGPGDVTFGNAQSAVTTATFPTAGTYVLRLTGADAARTQSRDVTVQVVENQPPVAMASANTPKVSILPATVQLTGGALDDGLPENPGKVSFRWSQVSGPASAVIVSPEEEITSANLPASAPGDYVFRLTADDGALTNSTDVHVSVVANLPPAVSAFSTRPIIDFKEGGPNEFNLACQAKDDGLPATPGKLSYSWTQVDGPSKIAFDDPAYATPKAGVTAPGVYQVRVTVSDGELATSADAWLKAVPARVTHNVTAPEFVQPFSPNPPPFVHPRVYFTEEDRPALAEKAKNDPLVALAIEQMKQGISGTLDNPKSPLGQAYEQFKQGNSQFDFRSLYPDCKAGAMMTGTGRDFYPALSAACYLAWLDQSDPKKMRELAKIVATIARCHAATHTPFDGLNHDVFADLGFCYDLTYNWMTEDERFTTRALLAYQTAKRHTPFWEGIDADLSTNWRDGHDHLILAALAIEGEPGFDARCNADNFEALKDFVSKWGINDQGFNREGPGYFSLGMHPASMAAYALSRRGENLFVTTNLYPCTLEMFYCMSPDTDSMWGHGDAEGWNNGSGAAASYDVFKAMYPRDELTDFVYRNALKDPGVSKNIPLVRAIFGHSPLPDNKTPADASKAKGLSLDVFNPQRGLGIARSDWTPDGVRLDFDDRFDCFNIGHMKTNRNSFYLYSNRRSWITDAGYHSVHNDLHSTVLIDGLGEAGSSAKPRWPSLPGKFLEHISTPDFALFAGDSKAAYTYEWGAPKGGTSSYDNEKHGVPTPYRWCDFFPPGYEPPVAMHGTDAWFADFMHADPDLYNPVERAFRTVVLARGGKPYVLVMDDIQKDANPHTYVWSANTNEGQGDMQIKPGATNTDAVYFREIDSAPKTPRLLVHVIDGKGQPSPVALDCSIVGDVATRRIVIKRDNVVAPDFKVLLYPHIDGDPMPAASLAGDTLTVKLPDGTQDEWKLAVQPDGRTRVVSFVRNGGAPPTITLPKLEPVAASTTTTYGVPSAPVNFSVTATDAGGAPAQVTCEPPSGTNFPKGQTPVVVTAADSAGRVSTTTFQVTVQ